MVEQLTVTVVAPDRQVWSGPASMAVVRTTEGEIGFLPGHAPLLGILEPGPLRIERISQPELVAAVHGGFVAVSDDRVRILAETVELADEIDVPRAEAALARAESGDQSDESVIAAKRRAEARLAIAGQEH